MFNEKVVLVNSADESVGEMDKLLAHHYPLHRHRAVSVWLTRKVRHGFHLTTQVLLQQRSRQKITGALWWGNTICGNVFPGETYEECAQRRLKGELDIPPTPIRPLYKFEYKAYVNDQYGENEVDQVFIGEYKGEVTLNPDEVKDVLWVDLDELKKVVSQWREQHSEYPTAAQSLEIKEDQLRHQTLAVPLQIEGHEITMVPWTMMMLLDDRLLVSLY